MASQEPLIKQCDDTIKNGDKCRINNTEYTVQSNMTNSEFQQYINQEIKINKIKSGSNQIQNIQDKRSYVSKTNDTKITTPYQYYDTLIHFDTVQYKDYKDAKYSITDPSQFTLGSDPYPFTDCSNNDQCPEYFKNPNIQTTNEDGKIYLFTLPDDIQPNQKKYDYDYYTGPTDDPTALMHKRTNQKIYITEEIINDMKTGNVLRRIKHAYIPLIWQRGSDFKNYYNEKPGYDGGIKNTIIEEPLDPVISPVLVKVVEDPVISPVLVKVVEDPVISPVLVKVVEDPVISPVLVKVVEDPVISPVLVKVVEDPVISPVLVKVVEDPVISPVLVKVVEEPVISPVLVKVVEEEPLISPVLVKVVEEEPVISPVLVKVVEEPVISPVLVKVVEEPLISPVLVKVVEDPVLVKVVEDPVISPVLVKVEPIPIITKPPIITPITVPATVPATIPATKPATKPITVPATNKNPIQFFSDNNNIHSEVDETDTFQNTTKPDAKGSIPYVKGGGNMKLIKTKRFQNGTEIKETKEINTTYNPALEKDKEIDKSKNIQIVVPPNTQNKWTPVPKTIAVA